MRKNSVSRLSAITLIAVITLSIVRDASTDEVLGCGGFVKSPDHSIDFSSVRLDLYVNQHPINFAVTILSKL